MQSTRSAVKYEEFPDIEGQATVHPLLEAAREIDALVSAGTPPNLLEAHLIYAKLGVPTFPVDPELKKPLIKTGTDHREGATTDLDVIRKWREKWPDARIGMPCGEATNTVVVDLDTRGDRNGVRAFQDLAKTNGGKGNFLLAKTASGGAHLFYEHPGPGIRVKSVSGVEGIVGIDSKADGGMVLLSPSPGADGESVYSWRLTEVSEPGDAPEWFLRMLGDPEKRVVLTRDGDGTVCEGSRNGWLFAKALEQFRSGLSEEGVLLSVSAMNASKCSPPLPWEEVEKIVGSAAGYRAAASEGGRDGVTALDLLEMEVSPPEFVIDGLMPTGATLLVGKAKVGKSWLALNIAVDVALGRDVLGAFPCCRQGRVLYFALEDTQRRLRARLDAMGLGKDGALRNLELYTELPRLHEGGSQRLEYLISRSEKPVLVAIDILEMVRPPRGNNGPIYESDYRALRSLKEIADRLGVAMMIVHHARKQGSDDDQFDVVSGSMGLVGAADTTMILRKTRDGVRLYTRGRDTEERELALEYDAASGRWLTTGDAAENARSPQRKQILEVMRNAEGVMGPRDVATATGLSYESVRALLLKMAASGEVKRGGRGEYKVPD